MLQFSRWLPSVLVLLAVFALAGTVPLTGVLIDAVLITVAVGLLVASLVLRHHARKRLIYERDRPGDLRQQIPRQAMRADIPPHPRKWAP